MTTDERLDHELGESEIRGAEEQEDQRDSEALNAERDDRRQPVAGDQHGGEAEHGDEE